MARGDCPARPRGSLRAWSLALLLICACRVDSAGLGAGTDDGGTGGAGGQTTGIGGATGGTGVGGAGGRATGVAGAGATTGGGGASGAGAGEAGGTGTAGTSGDAGATGMAGGGGTGGDPIPIAGAGGDASPGGAGGGGMGGEGARGGAGGAAGTGAVGTGGAGDTGGRGGAAGTGTGGRGGTGGGCGVCPTCTRCTNGACTPDPASLWKLRCVRATIAQTKPTGAAWDIGVGSTSAPDPKCAFWMGNSSAAETSTLSDTFAPEWNESITPGSRFTAGLLSSQSSPWSIRVTDEDGLGSDAICSISPVLDAATFVFGTVTFASGSCSSLEIGLECVSQ